jgi:hypothetical protein
MERLRHPGSWRPATADCGRDKLAASEQAYVVDVIDRWLRRQDPDAPDAGEPTLFD